MQFTGGNNGGKTRTRCKGRGLEGTVFLHKGAHPPSKRLKSLNLLFPSGSPTHNRQPRVPVPVKPGGGGSPHPLPH